MLYRKTFLFQKLKQSGQNKYGCPSDHVMQKSVPLSKENRTMLFDMLTLLIIVIL